MPDQAILPGAALPAAQPAQQKGKRGRYHSLTDYQKVFAAKYKRKHQCSYDRVRDALRQQFDDLKDAKLSNSTLASFLSKQHINSWADKPLKLEDKVARKARKAACPALERALAIWLDDMNSKGINISGADLRLNMTQIETVYKLIAALDRVVLLSRSVERRAVLL